MINVGRISYMNVAPVYYGLDNGMKPAWMNMLSAPPSLLNTMLANGELDISPVSSVAYARNQDDWLLLPDLSISCFGKVMSVILVSKYPLNQLTDKKVILTEESATAAALLRLLFSFKKIKPYFETGKIRYTDDLRQNDVGAALVIGDAALKEKWQKEFDYVFDLGEMWWNLTELPFVFALWAVRKSFAEKKSESVLSVTEYFHISKHKGLMNIREIIPAASAKLNLSADICRDYYSHLHYDLNPLQIKGLETFFKGLYEERIISKPVSLSFFEHQYLKNYAA